LVVESGFEDESFDSFFDSFFDAVSLDSFLGFSAASDPLFSDPGVGAEPFFRA
jgi:hypothetical protein